MKVSVDGKLSVITSNGNIANVTSKIETLVQTHAPPRALRSSDAPMLIVPRIHTELSRCAFSVSAPPA